MFCLALYRGSSRPPPGGFTRRTYRTKHIVILMAMTFYGKGYTAKSAKEKSHGAGFPGGTVVKNPPVNAGDTGSSPGSGRSHMPRSN